MKYHTRSMAIVLLICTLFTMHPIYTLSVFATSDSNNQRKENAMEALEADDTLNGCKQSEAQSFSDDGYIGIPYEVTVYYDHSSNGAAAPGYMTSGGTPVILYVINANFERIGTASDVSIITSMVERGYIVAVLDYLNSDKAVSPELDWSVQLIRDKLANGEYFTDKNIFPNGRYYDNIVVPAGYNVTLGDVYFELDKHGTDGTLEKIVNVWNNDFRLYKGNTIIKWVHDDGTRKATQNGFNGSEPVWYDANGKISSTGQYTQVQYTLAETITDCVKADGSPIDLNLYFHTIYPTSPTNEVPVMASFSSAGYLASATSNTERPQFNGFLFNGYAGVMFDYAWIPMGRDDHYGYFDGSSGAGKSITGDNQSYATYTFNASQTTTAAMRYTRYLSLTDHDTYKFNIDKIGVYGISKAAWMTHLGAPVLRKDLVTAEDGMNEIEIAQRVNDKINSFYQQLWLPGHHGETRYDNGITETYTKDGFTIDGGELQPWAVYNSCEISSGAQVIYSSCGASVDYIMDNDYSPLFITMNLNDTYNTEYGMQNIMTNLCRIHNVPSLWYEAEIAHTFANGKDYIYGVDIYDAFFDFCDYYLKDTPVQVTYTTPASGYAGMKTTEPITVKFIGEVTQDEIEKVTLTASNGSIAHGKWSSAYGNTEWTFTPDSLTGSEKYTLTIPADMAGANGKKLGNDYTAVFYTTAEIVSDFPLADVGIKMTDYTNTFFSFVVPSSSDILDQRKLRIKIGSGINTVRVFSADNPGDLSGKLLDEIKVSGEGWYEFDVTEWVMTKNAGDMVYLRLKTGYTSGSGTVYEENFDTGIGDFSKKTYTDYENTEIDGSSVLKMVLKTNYGKYSGDHYYYEGRIILDATKALNNGNAFSKKDVGRTFLITVRLYDTVARPIRIYTDSITSMTEKTLDYDRVFYNFMTKANEWVEFKVPYTVYETKYGNIGNLSQTIHIYANSTGNTEMPLYIDYFNVEEIFTDVIVTEAALVCVSKTDKIYKSPSGENVFTVNGEGYNTWTDAVNALTDNATLTLNTNYVLKENDFVRFNDLNRFTIDLNGYMLTSNGSDSVLNLTATTHENVNITVKNGSIILNDAPLISYTGYATDKLFSINLTDLYIGLADGAYLEKVISAASVSGTATITADITLTDCTVDIDRSVMALNTVIVFPAGASTLSLNYTFAGGKLMLDNTSDVTVTQTAINLVPNENGNYFTVVTPESVKDITIGTLIKDGELAQFFASESANGLITYTAQKPAISTKYGIIPDNYGDADIYPFAIFTHGTFISAKTTWSDAITTAIRITENIPCTVVQILLRRDHDITTSPDKLWKINGSLLIDLGEYSINVQKTLLEFGTTSDYTSAYTAYDTNITVKNGTLIVNGGMIGAAESINNNDKAYDLVFDNITFKVADTTNRTSMLITYQKDDYYGIQNFDITLNECTIDTINASGNKITVFNVNANDVITNITINGGHIIGENFERFAFISTKGDDSLTLGKGAKGDYPTLTLNNLASLNGDTYTTDVGTVAVFGNGITSNGKTVYTLSETPNSTPYGLIPENDTNRFAVFCDGSFVTSGGDWNYITRKVLDFFNTSVTSEGTTIYPNFGKTVYVLMRSDYSGGAGSTRVTAYNGTLVLDLNGNTFTRTSTMFECSVSEQSGNSSSSVWGNQITDGYGNVVNNYNNGIGFDTDIIVKNGSIVAKAGTSGSRAQIISVQNETAMDKRINFTFENVRFGIMNDPSCLIVGWSNNVGGSSTVNIDLKSCDFIFPNDTATGNMAFIENSTASNVISMSFKGGTISGDVTNIVMNKGNVVPSVSFGKYNDSYTTLTVPSECVIPMFGGINEEGKGVAFGGNGIVNGTDTIYTLVENDLVTKYGTIPSGSDNTFVVFYNGRFVSGHNSYTSALTAARNIVNTSAGSTAVILMRNDYVNTGAPEKLYLTNGTIVIDLDGHTLTSDKNTLFEGGTNSNYTESYKDYSTSVTVKNGTLVTGKGRILALENPTNYDKRYDEIKFENIRFEIATDSDRPDSFIAYNKTAYTGLIYADIIFDTCFFDLSIHGANPMSNFVKLNVSDVVANITVNGGIVSGSLENLNFISVHESNNSTVKYGRGNGEYTLFALTAGIPPQKITTTGGRTNQPYSVYSVDQSTGITTYKLGTLTDYGIIEPEYNYEKPYPFVIFMNGKNIIGASNWENASLEARKVLTEKPGATVQILLRADQSSGKAEQICFMNGTVLLDLGGYTLTATGNIFEFGTNGYTDYYDTTLKVINGTVLSRSGIAPFESRSDHDKKFRVIFENITFRLDANYTNGRIFYCWSQNGKGTVTSEITFNDCIFDLTGALSSAPVTLFNISSSGKPNLNTTIRVNGGQILADTMQYVTISAGGDLFRLIFSPGVNDTYTTLTLLSTATPPNDIYVTDKGNSFFGYGTLNGDNIVYGLTPCEHSYSSVCDPECNVCHQTRTPQDHSPANEWICENGKHWINCLNEGCNAKLSFAECSGGIASCTKKAVCAICGNEYGDTDTKAHTPSNIWSHDESMHWKKCENGCGTKLDHTAHSFTNYVSDGNATYESDGTKTAQCDAGCGATNTITDEGSILAKPNLKISGLALTLYDKISMNYRVDASLFTDGLYSDPYIEFVHDRHIYTITNYIEVNGFYIFTFPNVAPHRMNDPVYATLKAKSDGIEYSSDTTEYSVGSYCHTVLEKTTDEDTKLRTLLVDILNYGAVAQIYQNHNIDNLVNAALTEEQKSWGTSEAPTLTDSLNKEYRTVESPEATFISLRLSLNKAIGFMIRTNDITELTLKVEGINGTTVISSSDFVPNGDGTYCVYFRDITAAQMSELFAFTVYRGDIAVSNTVQCNLETCALRAMTSDQKLTDLLNAMLNYGNSAKNYISK